MEKVVLKCLGKKPSLRYDTVLDLLQAVHAALDDAKNVAFNSNEAVAKAVREKAEKEATELTTLLYAKFNKTIEQERSGFLEEALSIYYEISLLTFNIQT